MNLKLLGPTAGLVALTACPSGTSSTCDTALGACDSGDTDIPPDMGPAILTSVYNDCDPSVGEDGTWYYEAETDNWTTDGLLNIDQDTDPAWTEQHNLPSVDSTDNPPTDHLSQTLEGVISYQDVVSDQTTLFDCDNSRISTMMWMMRVFDIDGNMSDCAVWGADVSVYDSYGCVNWN